MTDVFEALIPTPDEEIDITKNYAEELIGDGKKYADLETAARALAEKEAHIKRVERENRALRENTAATQNLEELVTRLSKLEQSPSNPPPGNERDDTTEPVDLEAKLEDILTRREREARQSQNAEIVKKKLYETFGPNYVSHLNKKAEQLGMSTAQMNHLAATSPTAFLTLVGADKSAQEQVMTPPRSTVMPQGTPAKQGEKTQSYYRNLMKTDRNRYLSREVQLEMLSQAKKLGAAFYDGA